MNTFKWSACPLCKSQEIHEIGLIDYRKPIMFSTRAIKLAHDPMLMGCEICKSWFTQNIVPESVALSMYQSGSSSDKWPNTPPLAEGKSRNILDRLACHFGPGKKILDVGCNTGELLDHARSVGATTFGVEPSTVSRRVLTGKGHQTFSSLDEVNDRFDVITAFDLVEHLYDLPGFMGRVRNLLADDGTLIILTGDNNSLSARKSRQHWWYLKAPEHIVFPSQSYFKDVAGFQLLSTDATYASVGYQRSKIVQWLQFARKTFLNGTYEGLPSLGPDHMLLTLRKVRDGQ